jgi:hypothetical protein
MAANKTQPTEVSVEAFIAAVPSEARRADAQALIEIMGKVTGAAPKMWGPSIVGFGSYHYKYDSGREGDMPVAAFSPRAAASVLYLTTGFDGAKELIARFGKQAGDKKGCIYVKSLAAADRGALEAFIAQSVAARRAAHPQ